MATGESCLFVPFVNGMQDKPSILYRDFLKRVGGDRPFTNLIYASYLQDGVAEAMDKKGYRRDKNGEHKARDVYKFFNANQMRSEAGVALDTFGRSVGILDTAGAPVDFTARDAFAKALDINSKSVGRVAYVQQHGDKFNVFIENKDSRTQMRVAELQLQQLKWQALEEAFTRAGINLNTLERDFPYLVNPVTIDLFLQTIQSQSEVSDVKYLSKKDIEMLLTLGENTAGIKALKTRGWGNNQEIANKAFDVLHNKGSYAVDTYNAVVNALNAARSANDATITALKKEINDQITPRFEAQSKEFDIQNTINELNEKYNLDIDMLVLSDRHIRKLSEAAAHAMVTLNRQLEHLRAQGKGSTKQADAIRAQMSQLSKEISGKRYYSGLLGFLNKSLQYVQKVDNDLKNIPPTGTIREFVAARANVLATAKTLHDSYGFIVKSLLNVDSILIDENISAEDKAKLQSAAKEVSDILDTQENVIKQLQQNAMIDICVDVFGDSVIEGKAVADLVMNAEADTSIMDFLYSIGEQSNPMIGAMGTIIRDAQLSRDERLSRFTSELRMINDRLLRAGHNSEFMYEWVTDENGEHGRYYIQSNINWQKYNKERNSFYARQKASGVRGFELRDAMDAWIEANTEEVDFEGHTERIPKHSLYGKKKDFMSGWTDAQKEYYNSVMKLKAQIGTLLPEYAQYQYLPPQRRAEVLDIVNKGIEKKMSLKSVVKNILDRANPIKIRQDDTQYGMLIDGETYVDFEGDFDGTAKQQIPVFYVTKLKDQNDLLLDFSGALQSLAHTAFNYDEMNNIKSTVEMMGDYIESKSVYSKTNGVTQAELVENGDMHILSKLKSHAGKFGTTELIHGFIDKHLYGIEMKDTGYGWRVLQAIVNYTSLNQLAPNVKGAISNFLVGEHQMLIEAVSGTLGSSEAMYTLKDYAAAQGLLFGSKVQEGALMDHLTNNMQSLGHLLAERFDPLNEIAQENGGKRYYNSVFRQIIGGFNIMGMYSAGEAAIHYINMYASLLHEKVKDNNGKEVSLYSAFEKSEKKDGNYELKIKDGYTRLDGGTIDAEYLNTIKARIRTINQQTHGAMNREDKGLIHQRMAGRAVMNFRQWMVGHYSRRYRGRHWSASERRFTEGYFNTVGKMLQSYISDYVGFVNDANAHWDELDAAQKQNVWKALSEVVLLACLYGISAALGEPEDHKKEYWYRMAIYQIRRLILDEEASVPPIPFLTGGFVSEGVTILDSPVASVKTINGILYPITGIKDINKTIQSGRYKGWNKYGRNILKIAPFYNQIDQTLHLGDEGYVFSIFDK